MSRYVGFGIDLGTTNSCIARWDKEDVRVFQNNDLMNVTPSAVLVSRRKQLIVGRRAYDAYVQDPKNVAVEFKRLMGLNYTHAFGASGVSLSAVELSAEVLKSMIEDVRRVTDEQVDAAVIGVPAAFGTLQCDATAQAARLAGLMEAPLIQEPIAAAIAYGATPRFRDQRWMVFDLGGGTLDIAVVSTQDGHLTVIEHRGNNRLGGKDIDRLLVDQVLLPALDSEFALPAPESEAYLLLRRRLSRKAEEAKIGLTAREIVSIDFGDLQDAVGNVMDVDLNVTREQLRELAEPILRECLSLADQALEGARLNSGDLDRILLVGGPTQMPIVREALQAHTGVPLDCSLDPMTVVARGAALYAATLERSTSSPQTTVSFSVPIRLGYESVCEGLECAVVGRIEDEHLGAVREVKVESDDNLWSSGWIAVSSEGFFELTAPIPEGKVTRFLLSGRDKTGRAVPVEPWDFVVRQGPVEAPPPLTHTISVEVLQPDGTSELLPVLERGTPLPATGSVDCRSARALKPGDLGDALNIKLWEGEDKRTPTANQWIGIVRLPAGEVKRALPEGQLIRLDVTIDRSRLLTVTAFVPYLNQVFERDLYVREWSDVDASIEDLSDEIPDLYRELEALEEQLEESGDPAALQKARGLREEIADLDLEVGTREDKDLDVKAGILEKASRIRWGIDSLTSEDTSSAAEETAGSARNALREAEAMVEQYGADTDHERLASLKRKIERAEANADSRTLRKAREALHSLRLNVLWRQDSTWESALAYYANRPEAYYLNRTEARRLIGTGLDAQRAGNMAGVQEAVHRLWKLRVPDQDEADHEKLEPPDVTKA